MSEQTSNSGATNAVRWAGVLGAIAVAAGAFGAHALADVLSAHRLETWDTAARYQLVHAVALLALAAGWHRVGRPRLVMRLWAIGALVFSGTLYALCLSGVGILGAVTPLGGLCLIAGWSVLAATAR